MEYIEKFKELTGQEKKLMVKENIINTGVQKTEGVTLQQLKEWELQEWKKNDLRNKENVKSLRKTIENIRKINDIYRYG
jgi:hypothetical protein